MIAPKTVRLVQETVRLLRVQGEADKAEAVEAVLGIATSGVPARREYLTTGQAARALGVSIQTIKNWVTSGQLPAARLGARTVVHREAILRTLDALAGARPSTPPASASDLERAAQRRQFVLGQLPAGQRARLEALHAKLEAGEHLGREERTELRQLEQRLLELAGEKLDEWTARSTSP